MAVLVGASWLQAPTASASLVESRLPCNIGPGAVIPPPAAGLPTQPTAPPPAYFDVTETSPEPPAGDFKALAYLGDGPGVAAEVSTQGNGCYAVSAPGELLGPGRYTVRYTVYDTADGGELTLPGTTIVVDSEVPYLIVGLAAPIVGEVGKRWTGAIATFSLQDVWLFPTDEYEAEIGWGVDNTQRGTVAFGSGAMTVSASHTFAKPENEAVTLTLSLPKRKLGVWTIGHVEIEPRDLYRLIGTPLLADVRERSGKHRYELIFRPGRALPPSRHGRLAARLTAEGAASSVAPLTGSTGRRRCYVTAVSTTRGGTAIQTGSYPFTLTIGAADKHVIHAVARLSSFRSAQAVRSAARKELGCE